MYQARFDNEFLGETSTNGAAVDAAILALRTSDLGLALAAAAQLHENASDVAGNSIPVTGGSYNVDGLTVAEVLSTAHGQSRLPPFQREQTTRDGGSFPGPCF